MGNTVTGMNAIIPARNAKRVTPSDVTNFTFGTCKGILAGGAGNIAAVMVGDGDTGSVTVIPILAGQILPIQATRINSTSTTATTLVAFY